MNAANDTHSKTIGYILWIFGFTGSHRFYYGKPVTGTIWFFTLGLLGIGWLIDLFLIPGMDREANLRFRAGRVNYTTTVVSIGGSSLVQESRDNAYTLGIVGGLGMDVAILPNVFVRGEWEYVYFTPVKGITSSVNTARVGLGIRF